MGERQQRRARAGFTLIEVLVAAGLLVLVMGMLIYPLMTGYAYMEKANARADALAAAREAIDTMSRELAEAIFVFDPPVDRSMLAFYLGSGNQPAPQQEAGGEAVAVRYWWALRDPFHAYLPFDAKAAWEGRDNPNGWYVARAEVPNPQLVTQDPETEDEWNSTREGTRPVVRVSYRFPDGYQYPGGTAWPVAQPGWPLLEAYRPDRVSGPGESEDPAQWYADRVVALTPANADFNITRLEFAPRHVDNETLVPVRPGGRWPPDYGTYRARWPLWCHFSVWNGQTALPMHFEQRGGVRIYRDGALRYYTALDADGDVCIYDAEPDPDLLVYDTESYPARTNEAYAFGIDYDHGRVLFEFAAQDQVVADDSYLLPTVSALEWGWVQPASDHVSVDGVYYTRVSADPGPKQYRLVMVDDDNNGVPEGWRLEFDPDSPPTGTITVSYRYRNCNPNDLVIASYQTKGIIDIDLVVAKRDNAAREAAQSRQEVHLSQAVKLHNVVK